MLRAPVGVQHGVWTHLQSFLIIRESIDMVQQKLLRRPMGVNMKCENWHSDPHLWPFKSNGPYHPELL